MKIILSIVTSLDGRSTKNNLPPNRWASIEDQFFFQKIIKKFPVIIMGSNTYLQARDFIKLSPKSLRVVMTKNSKKFTKFALPGQLEFTGESPVQLIKRLEKSGIKNILLASGEKLNTQFFKQKLISEIWLTLEPSIFGLGKGIINESGDIKLKLILSKKLNSQGTLLLKYAVLY